MATTTQNPAATPAKAEGRTEIIQRYAANPLTTLQNLFERFESQIANALPRHMTPERMIRVAMSSVSQTPKLLEADPFTICGAVVQSSILGLEPNSLLGEAFLIPYWNKNRQNPITKRKGIYECQLQVGYKGHVKLARNSGEISLIDAQIVHENDEFDFDKGMNPVLIHKWAARGKRGEWIGAWAGYKLRDGAFNFEYMSAEDIIHHRDTFTKSKDRDTGEVYGPWVDNPEWMWLKTVLIKALKLAPKSVSLAAAVALTEQSEAGMTQRFTVDVPAMLNPPEDEPEADPNEEGEVKRLSETKGEPTAEAKSDTKSGKAGKPEQPALVS